MRTTPTQTNDRHLSCSQKSRSIGAKKCLSVIPLVHKPPRKRTLAPTEVIFETGVPLGANSVPQTFATAASELKTNAPCTRSGHRFTKHGINACISRMYVLLIFGLPAWAWR